MIVMTQRHDASIGGPGSDAHTPGLGRAFGALPRIIVALALLAAAAGMVIQQVSMRALEAALTATWLDPLITGGVTSFRDVFYVHMSPANVIAFRITAECTSVILIAPLLALAAIGILSGKVALTRGILAAAAMVIVITIVNQLRLSLIAWMSQGLGMGIGYHLSHTILGSILGIFGFALGAAAMLLIMGFRGKKATRL